MPSILHRAMVFNSSAQARESATIWAARYSATGRGAIPRAQGEEIHASAPMDDMTHPGVGIAIRGHGRQFAIDDDQRHRDPGRL
ncbi:MAG: hypothetical protein F4X02_12670 [Chloroflexi bacterium]|nr:hypothetical protein [Chloroflexota bacterium]